MKKLVLAAALAAALGSIGVASARAQDGGEGESAAQSRSTSFQAVEGSAREEISGGSLLLGAYGAILVMLVGYVGWIAMLQQRTQRDLARLRTAVDRGAAKNG